MLDPTKYKVVKDVARPDILFGLARVPNSQRVFFGSSDFNVYELDLSVDKPEAKKVGSHESYVTTVAIAGDYLISGSYDARLKWWKLADHEALRSVDAHDKRIRNVTASPDGKLLVSVADDMVCRVWDSSSGKRVHELRGHEPITPHHYPNTLHAVTFSSDGKLLATGDKSGKVVVWNVKSGKQEATFEAAGVYTWDPNQRRHSIGGIRSLRFSKDSAQIAVGGMGKVGNVDHPDAPARLEVYDWRANKRLHELQTDGKLKGMIEQLAFAPDGSFLVGTGGGYAGVIAFFDLAAGKIVFQDSSPMHVHGMQLDESGRRIYAAGHNKLVVWECPA